MINEPLVWKLALRTVNTVMIVRANVRDFFFCVSRLL